MLRSKKAAHYSGTVGTCISDGGSKVIAEKKNSPTEKASISKSYVLQHGFEQLMDHEVASTAKSGNGHIIMA